LFSDPVLTEIAAEHGKSVVQVVLRWLTQLGIVAIPKSVRRDRMEQNFDIFDFTLSDEQMSRIAGLDTGEGLFIDDEDPATVSQMSKVRFRGLNADANQDTGQQRPGRRLMLVLRGRSCGTGRGGHVQQDHGVVIGGAGLGDVDAEALAGVPSSCIP